MPAFSKLKKRKDFIHAAKSGVSVPTRTIVLQAVFRKSDSPVTGARIGYTTTKKIGKAVVRNLCRRRLRAAAALFFEKLALPTADYVLIARFSTADADFKNICRDLQRGLKKINQTLNGETDHDQPDTQVSVSAAD